MVLHPSIEAAKKLADDRIISLNVDGVYAFANGTLLSALYGFTEQRGRRFNLKHNPNQAKLAAAVSMVQKIKAKGISTQDFLTALQIPVELHASIIAAISDEDEETTEGETTEGEANSTDGAEKPKGKRGRPRKNVPPTDSTSENNSETTTENTSDSAETTETTENAPVTTADIVDTLLSL